MLFDFVVGVCVFNGLVSTLLRIRKGCACLGFLVAVISVTCWFSGLSLLCTVFPWVMFVTFETGYIEYVLFRMCRVLVILYWPFSCAGLLILGF